MKTDKCGIGRTRSRRKIWQPINEDSSAMESENNNKTKATFGYVIGVWL